eukprot:5541443-Alexandrium_andersonii.AAC.1
MPPLRSSPATGVAWFERAHAHADISWKQKEVQHSLTHLDARVQLGPKMMLDRQPLPPAGGLRTTMVRVCLDR